LFEFEFEFELMRAALERGRFDQSP
jgi:hypothetical protein